MIVQVLSRLSRVSDHARVRGCAGRRQRGAGRPQPACARARRRAGQHESAQPGARPRGPRCWAAHSSPTPGRCTSGCRAWFACWRWPNSSGAAAGWPLVFVTGHVGATLLVAAGLTAAIEFHWLPLSVSHASDVGVSYGAVAVLGALTSAIPRRLRPAWIGFWVPVGLAGGRIGRRLHRRRARRRADVGHAGRHPIGRPGALDAGAVRTAGRVRDLRLLDAGARRLVDGGCGGRRRGGCGSRPSY